MDASDGASCRCKSPKEAAGCTAVVAATSIVDAAGACAASGCGLYTAGSVTGAGL